MAIEVRVPTILRSYTGGAKVVQGSGDTLGALIDDLDTRHSGLKGRLITDDGGLHRFVNVYVNDEEPVVIYHSHTATEAYPSRTDISFAGEPGAHYVLVSTREPDSEEIRSFRIVDSVVTEEEVNIVDATVDA